MTIRLIILLAFISLNLWAQTEEPVVAKKLSFATQKAQFDNQEELAISVVIPLAHFEGVERNFEKRIDEFTKAKVTHQKGSYKLAPMEWPQVCDTSSVYFAHFEDSPYGLIWISAVECRERFIQPNDTKAWNELQKMIRVFAYEVYDDAFGKVVKEQEAVIKAQQKKIKDLLKEQDKAAKDIAKMSESITNKQTEIHDYDEELTALNAAIGKERSSRVSMTNPENIKASRSREKDLNKSRDKARKEQSKRKEDILDLNQEISSLEERIADIDGAMPEHAQELSDEETELKRLQAEYQKLKQFAKA